MKYQIETVITVENSSIKFYVKESTDENLTMIKNTIGDNFITLTLFNHSDVVSGKLNIRAKSITAIHEEKYF